ncbi:hypothetical protein J7K43_01150 [Candidatus Calescamantes bacterium]|nr:hypothetical protein [Candidatus Calescamantes bacterium]
MKIRNLWRWFSVLLLVGIIGSGILNSVPCYDCSQLLRRTKSLWIERFIETPPSREELLSYDQLEELGAIEGGKLVPFTPEVVEAIKQKLHQRGITEDNPEYGLLFHVLEIPFPGGGSYNRLLFKVDDRGSDLTYKLSDGREVLSWLEFGREGIVNGKRVVAKGEKSPRDDDVFAYIHITKALYEKYKDNPDILAGIIIRQYQKSFLQDCILNPEYAKQRDNFLHKIEQAKNSEDPRAQLTALLDVYDPTFDTMGEVKTELLKAILEAFNGKLIRNGKELLAWYRAEIEVGCQDVAEITRKIDERIGKRQIIVGGQYMVDISQAHRYLFTYAPTNPNGKDEVVYNNGQPVYLPQGWYTIEEDAGFSTDLYSFNREAVNELYDRSNELRAKVERGELSENEAVEELLNQILSGKFQSSIPLLKILAEDIKRLRAEARKKKERPIYSEYALNIELDRLDKVTEFLEHAIFDNDLVEMVVDMIKTKPQRDRKGPFIISVIGPQGGGKSTFCQLLRLALRSGGMRVEKMAIEKNMMARGFRYAPKMPYTLKFDDGTELQITEKGQEMRGDGMYLWELITAQLEAIREGERVLNPDSGKEVNFSKVDVFIYDGPLTRHGIDLPQLIDLTVTLTERESYLRFKRRLDRDVKNPAGKQFAESHFINEFAAKQFHQEWDIQRRDTLKPDGSDLVLRYGFDTPDEIFFREKVAIDVRRFQTKQRIKEEIQKGRESEITIAEAEKTIVDTLSEFLSQLSEQDEFTIINNIKSLAQDFPIFSRGWLSSAIKSLHPEKQEKIRSAVEKIIQEARAALREKGKVVRVIPVGPAGTRGFPFSTQGKYGVPKALQEFGGRTNLQDSIHRAQLGGKDVFIITSAEISDKIREAAERYGLSQDNVLVEPVGANTLACVALTLAILAEEYGEDTVVSFMTTDHDFEDLSALERAFEEMELLAYLEPALSVLGIEPREPNPNMGHILRRPKEEADTFIEDTYVVSGFEEKPPLQRAEELNQGGALWNSGKGTGKISTWLRAYQEFAPDYYEKIKEIIAAIARVKERKGITTRKALEDPEVKRVIQQAYEYFQRNKKHYITVLNEPIPTATLALGLGVVTYPHLWTDLGSLRGRWVEEYTRLDENGNLCRVPNPENVTLENVRNSNIILSSRDYSTKLHLYGIEGMVVAYNAQNKTLVMVPMLKDGNVKYMVQGLLSDPDLAQFVRLDHPQLTLPVRPGVETRNIRTNRVYLAQGGEIFINERRVNDKGVELVSETQGVTVYVEDGLVCLSDLQDVIIIKIEDEIYIYGPRYRESGEKHLQRLLEER